ncbi:sensor histidine kinase [Reinekea thalattae]|uniref:histidine kinase n=1 Tax=Reinekea thalattae TaxID=2593301 RepID=A0A5C8ZAA5_9GAMM|nr:ATP-binding protein [Reinekea thalattae]TXR54098.1 GHKL domain-containing protein [Reinekea thalattae]
MQVYYLNLNDRTQTARLLDADAKQSALFGHLFSYEDFQHYLATAKSTGFFVVAGHRLTVAPLFSDDPIRSFILTVETDAEQDQRSLSRILKLLNNTNLALERCITLDEIYHETVLCARHYLDLDRVGVLTYDSEQGVVKGCWGTDRHGQVRREYSLVLSSDKTPWFEKSLSLQGEVLVSEEVPLYEDDEIVGRGWNAISTIRYGDEVVGWLVCDNLIHGRGLSQNEQTVMALFSQTVGQRVARYAAEVKLKELNEQLEQKVSDKTAELQKAVQRLEKTQKNLSDTEKARTLASFTAGVAHEINNPIGFIRSNLSFIGKVSSEVLDTIEQLNNDLLAASKFRLQEIDEVIDESVSGLDRVSHIISLLQPLNNLTGEQPQSFDVRESIDFIILSLESNNDCVSVDIPGPPIMASLPMQVFTLALENVLSNAIESVAEVADANIVVKAEVDGNELRVIVIDNGKGISEESLKSIFDPFYTTKAVGEGVGLGLSLSENLLKMVSGHIEVSSKEGLGTRMTLIFPQGVITDE